MSELKLIISEGEGLQLDFKFRIDRPGQLGNDYVALVAEYSSAIYATGNGGR